MKLTNEVKERIDAMSYEDMLHRWRFAPVGDPIFTDESGEYFSKRMAELRDSGTVNHVAASKSVGWDRQG